jgi:hypothetical protein
MTETVQTLVENSLGIAWDYLEATGELGNPDTAANHLLDTIETMIRHGSAADCAFERNSKLNRALAPSPLNTDSVVSADSVEKVFLGLAAKRAWHTVSRTQRLEVCPFSSSTTLGPVC